MRKEGVPPKPREKHIVVRECIHCPFVRRKGRQIDSLCLFHDESFVLNTEKTIEQGRPEFCRGLKVTGVELLWK